MTLLLNVALIKQFTGGDTDTGRFLHENPIEFTPECKIFINTNHLPRTADDTVFSSGRVKLIPFDRHFTEAEQDTGLKRFFKRSINKSGILNWQLEGHRRLTDEGLIPSKKLYQKNKSVIYPMAMHSISNFLMVGVGYIYAIIFG